ncbi:MULTISPECIES: hypothetical protein [unclassified Sphingomonas]|uniref:hypothetical protein n=1 Tax=unclassified Sphingomonas TaxID=196159 RepID=UPI000FF24569|nr:MULTISPECIES: hypothetical protein [unclassified Sphingomonas]RKE42424.1 hypothetical protein C8J39_3680 [Sphingomonas sp. PP-CC-1A-547]TCM03777.1 hypothetical protein C8J41_11036 [Sphingomonas sp. PP-CC-3G-468]
MSISEKTLELNVTHELLALANGVSSIFWNRMPRRTIAPPPGPPIYALGLTLREEARAGWDVSIELPVHGSTPSKIFFLQFKLGESRTYSKYPGSVFLRGSAKPQHIVFEFNNNKIRNQHSRLKHTAQQLGSPQAAIYALPLVTELGELKIRAGRLLMHTAFVTAIAIDRTATPPVRDGTPRKIAISSTNPLLREVRSKARMIEDDDVGAELIAEVLAVRLHREMVAWSEPHKWLIPEARRHVARQSRLIAKGLAEWLGYFFDVNPRIIIRMFSNPDSWKTVAGDLDGGHYQEFVKSEMEDLLGQISDSDNEDEGDSEIYIEDMTIDRLSRIVNMNRSLINALISGSWIGEVPELPELNILISAEDVMQVRVEVAEEGIIPGSARLNYLVV